MRSPEDELAELDAASLRRTLRPVDSPQQPESIIYQKEVTSFASNDYLGLATHPALRQAATEAIETWGTGSGASRLITGSLSPHRQLEEFIAKAKKTESAITFANGYTTSVGTLSALLEKGDTVILDKLSHASLVDGARLSGATVRVFPHNNLDKLERLLQSTSQSAEPNRRILIVTESVFSMDGDLAPLREIVALKEKYHALLLVDEAHALGIYGSHGMGLAEQLGCSSGIDFHMGTLGKSAGSAGGYIAGSKAFIDLIVNKARSFIYSTAAPPAQAAASLAALKLIQSGEGAALREKLWSNLRLFSELTDSPLPESAIIPWMVGDSQKALDLSNQLFDQHSILAPAVRYPTVPRNTARLRITITAAHSEKNITQLCEILNSLA
ncbi:8-amino-7-oxononanoate synthase [Rubritalea squalenifaciens DSM 18772]|uniref:8-amino-7-oxononanoate synthase n=1 Tax=Rubritalea squalenifaciens DSM 18772 TaxID=1123071 RepID=A0A1M6DY33_9BACT|nr:8-amino-7-oxononanoate synthase [Rubritalea squalenifaciens]SHI78112.1 8-amino-7-oxononanoate synthase [Rubritalea squalenifaciens DSM 18772]